MKVIFLYIQSLLLANDADAAGNVVDTDTIVYSIVILCLFLVMFAFFSWRTRKRVARANEEAENLKGMMEIAIELSDYSVVEFDVETNRLRNKYGQILPDEGCSLNELLACIHPDSRAELMGQIEETFTGKQDIFELNGLWKPFRRTDDTQEPEWRWVHGHSLTERGKDGKVVTVMFTIKDVTNEHEEEVKSQEQANRFKRMFESTLVAMSFYDANGHLIDLNENMRELCGFDEEGEKYYHTTRLFDFPQLVDDFDPRSRENFYVCQHMRYGDDMFSKYIEFRVQPAYEQDHLQFYVVTARDITAERSYYLELCYQNKELQENNEMRNRYESELKYLLENSQMWVWKSDLATQRIVFSRSLRQDDFVQTFDEFAEELYDDQIPIAEQALGGIDGPNKSFNVTLHFKNTPASSTPQWAAITGIPVVDEKTGEVIGHFGVVRDVTMLMEAQEQLKLETSRAEDSGRLKSVFLANMTHEIRTPLNAIVGFSDLLQVIDTPEERREFIRIIRNNCDMLMRLINDIIEASNINQTPLSIEATDVDFAQAFSDICQTLSQRVQEPGVAFIVDNPYSVFLTHVDKGRLQQVITNFTTNAVKYTHQGHIKVGYRYEDGGIYMYCEDTGAGIPKEKQDSVFERFVKLNDFVQGTGLGLSICKSIADRCNGRIGVSSEGEGCGSTFWIWIPCECKQSVLLEEMG